MQEWSRATFGHVDVAPTWAEVGATDAGVFASGASVPEWLYYSRNRSGAARLNTAPDDAAAAVPSRIVRACPAGYSFGPAGVSGAAKGTCGPANQEFRCPGESMNDIFRRSVFRSYTLIGTPWREGKPGEGGILAPEIVGNATMETCTQAESSRISCHSHAAPRGVKGPVFDFPFSFDHDMAGRSIPIQGNRYRKPELTPATRPRQEHKMDAQQSPGYHATRVIAELSDNDDLRQEFMNVYGVDNAAAKTFLVTRLGMPDDRAQSVVDRTGDDLSAFVGGNVRSSLW